MALWKKYTSRYLFFSFLNDEHNLIFHTVDLLREHRGRKRLVCFVVVAVAAAADTAVAVVVIAAAADTVVVAGGSVVAIVVVVAAVVVVIRYYSGDMLQKWCLSNLFLIVCKVLDYTSQQHSTVYSTLYVRRKMF